MKKENGTYFTDGFVEFIVKNSGGFLSSEELDKLFALFKEEACKYNFTEASENNLRRIIESSFDRITFIRELLYYSHHAEILFAIACNSNYLTDIVVRNPEYLFQLFDSEYLMKRIDSDSVANEIGLFSSRYGRYETVVKMLKRYKRRMILKIGINDILGADAFEETVAQLSVLANETLSFLFKYTFEKTLAKYGVKSTSHKYALVSLGKLGGGELNYSSDVDLILFFDRHGKIGNVKKDYFELLNETVQTFIQAASESTQDGYLYRIDFRLRPDGKNSPLARALGDCIAYYETRAEEWERQMLIKLRFLCGSESLFDKFKSFAEHYVYPLSLKTSPQNEIKRMKRNIERKLSGDGNVKLFSGGIRDIEFSVQALQLINGGRTPQIRSGSTLEAIIALRAAKLLSEEEANTFTKSYKLYRKIEHYRQLLNDIQTHDLPEDEEQLNSLAQYLKFETTKDFLDTLYESRKNVREIFESIVGEDSINKETEFDKINFSDKRKAERNLAFLRGGIDLSGVKKFDKRTSRKFETIEPYLYEFLAETDFPDAALDNLTKVIGASPKPDFWYGEFSNKEFFKKIFFLFATSEKVVETLLTAPKVGETLLTRKAFVTDLENDFEFLSAVELRFILSVRFALKLINHSQLSETVSKYIDYKIRKAAGNISGEYFIAAMGSYGAREMGLESDVDLIFAVDKISDGGETQKEFQAFLKKIKSILFPFEVDCRLRPEGDRSPLAVEAKSFKEYFAKRARIWEFQSFLKFRFVCGNEKLFEEVRSAFSREFALLNGKEAKREALAMRKKLIRRNPFGSAALDVKKSPGALIDIEFILFLGALKLNDKERSSFSLLERVTGTIAKIDFLTELKIFDSETSDTLRKCFSFFKTAEFASQNLFASRGSVLAADEEKRKKISNFFEFASSEKFFGSVKEKIDSTLKIFIELSKPENS